MMTTDTKAWKRCRIYLLTADELALLVARGLGVQALGVQGRCMVPGGIPAGLNLPLGSLVREVWRDRNGAYAVKVQHDDWPETEEGAAYPVVREVR